jgi:glycosyltransferase involved in cell wall biosynthesis
MRLVSVLMAAFNVETYIEEAIHSILNQTYSHFELLICDDGSTDATWSKIKEVNDQRIKFYRHEKNLGYPATMNALFAVATGTFVMI